MSKPVDAAVALNRYTNAIVALHYERHRREEALKEHDRLVAKANDELGEFRAACLNHGLYAVVEQVDTAMTVVTGN